MSILGCNKLIANWQLSGIETVQTGLPFTPQLSYNPSNDGDTRNPVRPSWNPSFTGPVILGGPNLTSIPTRYSTAARNLRQRRPQCSRRPGTGRNGFVSCKKLSTFRADELAVPLRFFNILNHTNFNAPNPVVYASATGGPSPTAGLITSTATTSRQIQFGLKLLW